MLCGLAVSSSWSSLWSLGRVVVPIAVALSLLGCSSSGGRVFSTRDEGAGPLDAAVSFPDVDLAMPFDLAMPGVEEDAAEAEDLAPDPCLARAKIIYTIDENDMLRAFDPANLKFINIGILNCPAGGASPFSMGVDHNAVAWVLYNDGQIFAVDTQTAACKPTAYAQQGDFRLFGMGFVADQKGNVMREHLFVAGLDNMELGVMDPKTLLITPLGPLTGNPELTGTGGAVLWGFFPDDQMPRVALLDKATGNEGMTYNLAALAGTPTAWAFAFWGGNFWIFLRRQQDNSTHVWKLDTNSGKVTDVVPNTGYGIVGAGVSICAPTGSTH